MSVFLKGVFGGESLKLGVMGLGTPFWNEKIEAAMRVLRGFFVTSRGPDRALKDLGGRLP